ncbi:MAG: hypothetical protein SPJ70_01570 [Candidatus Borkfalkiaceae bacterium]|nr:hypothetical protein [Christensenellaceae bacterium]
MSAGRTKNATLNILFAIILQLVTFVRGLILPRIIIPAYGSDINGLVSSITQFLTYISLLEAGVGTIFRSSLYKPLADGDTDKVSGVINEQKRFYRKIGLVFVFYVIALCFIYPLIAKTKISTEYIVSFILILSISTFAEYFISLPYVSLLSADQKVRISYIVSIVYTIVNILVALFWVWLKADIRLIYLSMCVIGLLRPLFYWLYVKKHYNLSKTAAPDASALKQRWNGMVHHVSYYVHTNTDSAILTIFVGTAMVSVYNVYGAIIFGMERLITSVSAGTAAGIGNILVSGDKKTIDRTVDLFEFVQSAATTVLFTITALMIMPFIKLYTSDMTDINYIYPEFAYVLVCAEAIYCFRCIYSTISTNANKFKETQLGAILECVVNLILSLILTLACDMGLLGIAIGTLAGMFVRYLAEVLFLSKNVINRSVLKAFKSLLVNACIAAVSILICHFALNYDTINSLSNWIIFAIISSFVVIAVAIPVYLIFKNSEMKTICSRIFPKRRKNK